MANIAACCLPPANGAYQTAYQTKGNSPNADIKKQSKRKMERREDAAWQKAPPRNNQKKTPPKKQAALEDRSQNLQNKSDLLSLNREPKLRNKRDGNEKTDQQTLKLLRSVDNLQHPQSITFDQKRLRFYVSQLGEKAQPSTGSIALLARDGSVINQQWIKGLNQPRGMAMAGGMLYVADGKSLLKIDVETAKVIKRFEQPNSFYLYDVSASKQGDIYVSDPLSNSILKLENEGTLNVWLKDKKLEGPNSLALKGGKLYVSSIGLKNASPENRSRETEAVKNDREETSKGKINQVDVATKKISSLTTQNNLEKIASLGIDEEGTIYATSLGAPRLMRFSLKNGNLLENIDVQKSFDLKETQGLADFLYFPQSKEFWVPVKNNGHLLVFVRGDATLLSESKE